MQGGRVWEAAMKSAGRGGFWLPYTEANKALAMRGSPAQRQARWLSHTSLACRCFQSPQAVFLCRWLSGEQVGGLPTSGDFPGLYRASLLENSLWGQRSICTPFLLKTKCVHVASIPC